MLTGGLRFVLLVFATIGFAGAGVALAVARHRQYAQEVRDYGMLGIAAMLFAFGALCTSVATVPSGVFAFGLVTAWASYLFMAQQLGVFRIETTVTIPEAEHTTTPGFD